MVRYPCPWPTLYTESSRATRHVILAVDLGGTKLATGLVDTTPAVLRRRWRPALRRVRMPACADLLARLDEEVRRASGAIEAIGVGTASMVDFARGIDRDVDQSAARRLCPARRAARERYDLPAVIDNDATVACIGEHQWGAGRGVDEMLMLTIGTGIGGGIISGGKPYRGLTGAGRRARPHGHRRQRSALPGQLPEPRLSRESGRRAPRSARRRAPRPSSSPSRRSAGRWPPARRSTAACSIGWQPPATPARERCTIASAPTSASASPTSPTSSTPS